MNHLFIAEKLENFRWTKYSPRCRIGVNCCTRNGKTIIYRRCWEHILNTTDLGVAVVIFRFSKEKKFFFEISLRILKKKIFFSLKSTEMSLDSKITIRMIWNRNMLLMDISCTSDSLLMTFWKIFELLMIFFDNFEKKSSATRKCFKKSSEVNQRCV